MIMEIDVRAWQGRAVTVTQEVEIVAPGIGRTSCWECEGTGDWTRFHPEPELYPDGLDCVECKGQGHRFVDAWALPAAFVQPVATQFG